MSVLLKECSADWRAVSLGFGADSLVPSPNESETKIQEPLGYYKLGDASGDELDLLHPVETIVTSIAAARGVVLSTFTEPEDWWAPIVNGTYPSCVQFSRMFATPATSN